MKRKRWNRQEKQLSLSKKSSILEIGQNSKETSCHSVSNESPPANARVKNSQGVSYFNSKPSQSVYRKILIEIWRESMKFKELLTCLE